MARFKKGKSGNAKGRPPMPPDIKNARQLNQIEVERIYHEVLSAEHTSLDEYVIEPGRTVLEAAVAKVMMEAIEGGDVIRLEKVLDRCVGKVKEKVEHSADASMAELVLLSMKEK